jgi:hypothetical protein
MFTPANKDGISPEVKRMLAEAERIEIAQAKTYIERAELTLKQVRARWAKNEKRVAAIESKLSDVIARERALAAEHEELISIMTVAANILEASTQ